MNIVLARIDDRLIHGQVVTVWSKVTNCQRIIVCDDDVANDKIRATLLFPIVSPRSISCRRAAWSAPPACAASANCANAART